MSQPPTVLSGRLAVLTAAAVLAAAVVLQALPLVRPARVVPPAQLAARLPAAPGGWVSRTLPLGPSEFLQSEVEKVLNFDDIFYREYERGRDRFSVYVAYWSPGRMPTQLVASHTPDRCWTENGWHCLEMRFRQSAVFPGAGLPPVEWRLFEPPAGGERTYVVYWHLVDGESYDYGERFNAIPDPVRWWRGALHQALRGAGEQYFVRVMSDQPLEGLWSDPGFREVVAALRALAPPRAPALSQ